ncbi:spindle assembly abnormal protein 6 homolog [Scaptodrosophila lebanonensis]|uniref:Spindle assembly abnormal protein 6 homolog n=1 Tax=Drosophila lebanonensis TaxID=7225 RepID=A0A6J2T2Z9_DROLE|nr:spindle assembly abnormal protein 6 homolog [Scaptodrosophila lebanonensis]
MWATSNKDNYFVNRDYNKNVLSIMPCMEMTVNFCFSGDAMRAKKTCLLYAEKLDCKELIQLRLAEKCDQRRMYLTTVDSARFHELKQDQSLNVTFMGFIDNLVKMLKDCQAGSLELWLSARDAATSSPHNTSESQEFHLQFVEIRAFKNLVHLYLPCRSAPLNTVLFYMNAMLDAAHRQVAAMEQNTQQLQLELNSRESHVEQLGAENNKLREAISENSRQLGDKYSADLQAVQDKLMKINEQRSNEMDRNRRTIAGLQAQLDKASQDKGELKSQLEQAEKRSQSLSEELSCSKSRICSLKEQNERLQSDVAAEKQQERKLEYKITDLKQQMTELQDQIQKCNKEKANVAAELEAEKKILHTKRQALEMASDEISKANQIIVKRNQEVVALKKTIAWRTEVALQQEKAIQENEKLLCLREDELRHTRKTIQQLQEEIPKQLESMRQFAEGLEKKYTAQIHTLQDRLAGTSNKENYGIRANSARRK